MESMRARNYHADHNHQLKKKRKKGKPLEWDHGSDSDLQIF